MFSSVFEYFSPPTSKNSSDMEHSKAKMGESVANSAGAYWKHSEVKGNVEMDQISSSIQLGGRVDRRTKELEKQHRPESNWFQPEVEEQANYQSRMVWDVMKGDEQMEPAMDHQMVWDLTSNCYQELPVQQVSPYLPAYHQIYPCPAEEPEDSVALAPTALPLVNLFGGVFMEFVDTLYTSTLVQYVCERTAPSEHRMAAEVLARSNLNPNAKEFNPSQDLNLSKDVSLKEELNEKESSASEPEGDVKSSSQIEIHTVPLEAPCDNSACDIAFEENGEKKKKKENGKGVKEEEEEEEEEGRELEEPFDETAQGNENYSSKKEYDECVRANEEILKANDEADEESLEADEESGCEAEDADEESEDWWDSDEEPCTPSQEIDPAEFEDLFSCPLSLSCLHPTKQTTPSTSTSSTSSSSIGNSSPPLSPSSSSPSSFTSVATISLAAAAPTKAETRLEIVNRAFNEKYSTGTVAAKSKPFKVHFSEEATWQVIEEPEELAEDLCEARCSDLEQRRADRERMERLLGPVLTPVHRRRMFCKIYGDLEEELRQQEHLEERQQSGFKEEL